MQFIIRKVGITSIAFDVQISIHNVSYVLSETSLTSPASIPAINVVSVNLYFSPARIVSLISTAMV